MRRKNFCVLLVIAAAFLSVGDAEAKSFKDFMKSVEKSVKKTIQNSSSTTSNDNNKSTSQQPRTVETETGTLDVIEGDYDTALFNSIEELAQSIVQNNKHAKEFKLSGKDLEYYTWDENGSTTKRAKSGSNRVWAKGSTIVVGTRLGGKNFYAGFLVTADPNYIFAGGIHVGSSVATLKKYLDSDSFGSYSDGGNGYIHVEPLIDTMFSYDVSILYANGKITQIAYCFDGNANTSKETDKFVRSQMRTMGMKEFPSGELYR